MEIDMDFEKKRVSDEHLEMMKAETEPIMEEFYAIVRKYNLPAGCIAFATPNRRATSSTWGDTKLTTSLCHLILKNCS